jgi:hypothetical protein
LTVAILGVVNPAVRSGQAVLTVPETADVERAEVTPPAFVASIVYVYVVQSVRPVVSDTLHDHTVEVQSKAGRDVNLTPFLYTLYPVAHGVMLHERLSQLFQHVLCEALNPVGVDGGRIALNVAIHVLFVVIITCPLALQSPLQPMKVDEALGVAVAVTEAHDVYVPVPVVVPHPVPVVLIVRA